MQLIGLFCFDANPWLSTKKKYISEYRTLENNLRGVVDFERFVQTFDFFFSFNAFRLTLSMCWQVRLTKLKTLFHLLDESFLRFKMRIIWIHYHQQTNSVCICQCSNRAMKIGVRSFGSIVAHYFLLLLIFFSSSFLLSQWSTTHNTRRKKQKWNKNRWTNVQNANILCCINHENHHNILICIKF